MTTMMMTNKTPWWIRDLLSVIFPNTCPVCGRIMVDGESTMCLHCLADMPRTSLHQSQFNMLHQRIGHKIPIEKAAAYFYYERDSSYAKLIHLAKYRSMPKLARKLGAQYAQELMPTGFFQDIDLIEPVPLSFPRLIKRGYNQSEEIARGVAYVTGIPIGHHLHARGHATQTRKDARQRWENVQSIYHAQPLNQPEPTHRHVLIIDDIITTGATMAACANALRLIWPQCRISVMALGATRLA